MRSVCSLVWLVSFSICPSTGCFGLAILRVESRVWCMVGKHRTTKPHTNASLGDSVSNTSVLNSQKFIFILWERPFCIQTEVSESSYGFKMVNMALKFCPLLYSWFSFHSCLWGFACFCCIQVRMKTLRLGSIIYLLTSSLPLKLG